MLHRAHRRRGQKGAEARSTPRGAGLAAAGPRAACALRSVRLPVALHRRLSLKTAKEEKRREVLDFGGVKRRLKLIPRVPSETARKEPAARPCGEKPPPPPQRGACARAPRAGGAAQLRAVGGRRGLHRGTCTAATLSP